MGDLQVPTIGGGYVYVGHGERCVMLAEYEVPKWRNSLWMAPDEARRLAQALMQQADASEAPLDEADDA
jgi:hypothetical protein